MRKVITIFVTIIILFNVFVLNANADIQSWVLAIDPVEQAKSNWCWAASCEMAG